jgi:hypothetical protein
MIRVRNFSRKQVRAARKASRQFVKEGSGTEQIHGARLRGEEETRLIFAVFYNDPERSTRPMPYRLVAIEPASGIAEEITPPRESPCWIRGYR